MIKIQNKGITLVELMISMALFSVIMTVVLSTVHSMTIARIKNMNQLTLTDKLYFFSEQLFTEIKNGGTIDYEEYWNRKLVGSGSYDSTTQKEQTHYVNPTGVGNFGLGGDFSTPSQPRYGAGLYHCVSTASDVMGVDGCTKDTLNDQQKFQTGAYQRFGEYSEQFWDYNANHDTSGDENGDKSVVGDEDDKNLWNWPAVFGSGEIIREIYLINNKNNEHVRTFLRWKNVDDPNRQDKTKHCNVIAINGEKTPDDNCLGTIQILKLRWYDYGLDHNNSGTGAQDGIVDTWVCAPGWNCEWPQIGNYWKLATGADGEWRNLFPSSVTVRKFRVDIFPKKDPWLAAAAKDCDNTDTNCVSPFIHPYVRFSIEIWFSHGVRRTLRWDNPAISYSTTISLDDFK